MYEYDYIKLMSADILAWQIYWSTYIRPLWKSLWLNKSTLYKTLYKSKYLDGCSSYDHHYFIAQIGSKQHTDLPMGSHTHTTSTHHCGKCCGTTWHGPERPRTGPCSWDAAAVLCPGMRSLTHMQQHSNAASCCLHLNKHPNKMHHQILA